MISASVVVLALGPAAADWACNYEKQNLTQVPLDIPANCTDVNLHANFTTHLPPGVFTHLTQCKKLNISHNNISAVEDSTFAGLINLQLLSLSYNKIYEIKNSKKETPGTIKITLPPLMFFCSLNSKSASFKRIVL